MKQKIRHHPPVAGYAIRIRGWAKRFRRSAGANLGAVLLVTNALLPCSGQETPQQIDYLSLSQGALPVALEGNAAALGVGMDRALLSIDGDSTGFVLTPKPGVAQTTVGIVYRLPALTIFKEFAIPNVLETPSPSQTFVRRVEIAGSDRGPSDGFALLASSTLTTHSSKGKLTVLPASSQKPVRWVRVTMTGGIDVQRDKTFFEFSEIVGYGQQEAVPLSDAFTGKWKGRGVLLELKQQGASVSGCYDGAGDLEGTVIGNILLATGKSRNGGIPSTFILAVGDDRAIIGVQATNRGRFRLYTGAATPGIKTECSTQTVRGPGCGSTIHGIQFDFDSASIREESFGLLDALSGELKQSAANAIRVLGHTSSEGSDAYNLELSKRRAKAIMAALVQRGVNASRLAAQGLGETQPIADNATDAGRSLNRRVEISCQ